MSKKIHLEHEIQARNNLNKILASTQIVTKKQQLTSRSIQLRQERLCTTNYLRSFSDEMTMNLSFSLVKIRHLGSSIYFSQTFRCTYKVNSYET